MRTKELDKWIEKTCDQCGEIFDIPIWRLKAPSKNWYCSSRCYHQARCVPARERFERYLAPINENGCILWTGAVSSAGYGVFCFGRKIDGSISAHRFAYTLANGTIPKGLMVCHTCDVRSCCNPDHLFTGTGSDNMVDARRKGKCIGTSNGMSRVTEDSVREIRRRVGEGENQVDLADQFGLSRAAVCSMVNRRTWRHVK